MAVRTLYIARHGAADALGNLLEQGRDQCARLARRLTEVPLRTLHEPPRLRPEGLTRRRDLPEWTVPRDSRGFPQRPPLDAIWHSPLARAADSAAIISAAFPGVLVDEAGELVDHVPYVPPPEQRSPSAAGFFDGYSEAEAEAGHEIARSLVRRFAHAPGSGRRSTHELLITHAYPLAWLVREALGAPPAAWLSLTQIANTGLTVIEFADGEPPAVICVNDQSHLAPETGERL